MSVFFKILIADHNHYFSQGLRDALSLHFKGKDLCVQLTNNIYNKHIAQIVFVAEELPSFLLRYLSHQGSGPAGQYIFIIKDRQTPLDAHKFKGVTGILYRNQSLRCACRLVAGDILKTLLNPLPQRPPRPLTLREVEVIRCLACWQRPSYIARRHGLSIKTISTHKRNAMAKLGLKSSADLNYWLLLGGLNKLPTTMLPNSMSPLDWPPG